MEDLIEILKNKKDFTQQTFLNPDRLLKSVIVDWQNSERSSDI